MEHTPELLCEGFVFPETLSLLLPRQRDGQRLSEFADLATSHGGIGSSGVGSA